MTASSTGTRECIAVSGKRVLDDEPVVQRRSFLIWRHDSRQKKEQLMKLLADGEKKSERRETHLSPSLVLPLTHHL